jgi:glycosyltransferase involved in cell wall biosynthesis
VSGPGRVLYLTTSMDRGGAQRQIVDLAARLGSAGWKAAVLSMTTPTHYLDELAAADIDVTSLDMAPGRPTVGAWIRYGRFIRRWKPDVIHSHMVHANLLARTGRLFAPRVPVICTVHNVVEGARWREIAYRLTDPLATVTTAVSEAAAERYVRVGAVPKGRIEAVPNGFDFSRQVPTGAAEAVREELGVGDGFLWVSVGRLDRQKGYDLLLTAFDAVRRTRPDVRLAIAGDGPEREALAKIVDRLDLADSAFLLGDRHDVPAILAAADAFVLSSRWEGLPMVLLEAGAAELPIVSTDVGGNREIARPDLGAVLVDVDPEAMTRGMLEVMNQDPAERASVGRALRDHVRAVYDIEAVVERWKQIYGSVIARRREMPR